MTCRLGGYGRHPVAFDRAMATAQNIGDLLHVVRPLGISSPKFFAPTPPKEDTDQGTLRALGLILYDGPQAPLDASSELFDPVDQSCLIAPACSDRKSIAPRYT